MSIDVFISFGSNIEREKNCRSALQALEKNFGPIDCSSIYESEAVGFEGDPFYNGVVHFKTDLTIKALKQILAEIEKQQGRCRGVKKFSSRTLDLDLLLYGDVVIPEINIPRDEIESYAFVLEPLDEIAPEIKHPVSGKTFATLWKSFDKAKSKQHKIKHPFNPR